MVLIRFAQLCVPTFPPSFPAAPGNPCSPGTPGGPGWPLSPVGPGSPDFPWKQTNNKVSPGRRNISYQKWFTYFSSPVAPQHRRVQEAPSFLGNPEGENKNTLKPNLAFVLKNFNSFKVNSPPLLSDLGDLEAHPCQLGPTKTSTQKQWLKIRGLMKCFTADLPNRNKQLWRFCKSAANKQPTMFW